jgi:hypothetical protein
MPTPIAVNPSVARSSPAVASHSSRPNGQFDTCAELSIAIMIEPIMRAIMPAGCRYSIVNPSIGVSFGVTHINTHSHVLVFIGGIATHYHAFRVRVPSGPPYFMQGSGCRGVNLGKSRNFKHGTGEPLPSYFFFRKLSVQTVLQRPGRLLDGHY